MLRQLRPQRKTVWFWRVFHRIHSIQEGRGHPPRPPPRSQDGSLIIISTLINHRVPGRPVHPHPHRSPRALLHEDGGVAPDNHPGALPRLRQSQPGEQPRHRSADVRARHGILRVQERPGILILATAIGAGNRRPRRDARVGLPLRPLADAPSADVLGAQVSPRVREARHAVVGERGVRRRVRVRVHAAVRGGVRGVRAGRARIIDGGGSHLRQQPAHTHARSRGTFDSFPMN